MHSLSEIAEMLGRHFRRAEKGAKPVSCPRGPTDTGAWPTFRYPGNASDLSVCWCGRPPARTDTPLNDETAEKQLEIRITLENAATPNSIACLSW